MDHILPKVQSKWDIITDLFLEEGIIHFSGKLSTETDPAIKFGLVNCIAIYIYIYIYIYMYIHIYKYHIHKYIPKPK